MTREDIVEGLKLLEDNMVHFDKLQNDKGEWIDVHELLFEAIQALERANDDWKEGFDMGWEEAKVFYEEEPTEKPMCDRNICISNEYNGIGCDKCIVNKAEQEPCEKCKYFDGNSCQHYDYKVGYTQGYEDASKRFGQEPCDDAISRKKAICVISACDGKSAQIEALEQLPSVTQKSVLEQIRAEIDSYCSDNRDRNDGLYIAMRIIDKHTKGAEE